MDCNKAFEEPVEEYSVKIDEDNETDTGPVEWESTDSIPPELIAHYQDRMRKWQGNGVKT